MAAVRKVFGPPGSGKTTYLLNQVETELENGVSPARIGYFSFTRKAANEARDRAIAKFPHLNAKTDFPYFRTLHSLAFFCVPQSHWHTHLAGLVFRCRQSTVRRPNRCPVKSANSMGNR